MHFFHAFLFEIRKLSYLCNHEGYEKEANRTLGATGSILASIHSCIASCSPDSGYQRGRML
jgi:hypothetical protein